MRQHPISDKCDELCVVHNIESTLYECNNHGEFYWWPKLSREDVKQMEALLISRGGE